MALETDDDRAQYATNATTGPFTVPFYFLANEDIAVTYTNSAGADFALILDVDYTVTGANDPAGGTITTVVAYPSGGKLTILRDLAFIQPVVYEDGDPFPAKTHERALDRNMMASQQLREQMTRVLQFSPSDTNSPVLPSAAERANTILGFNNLGDIVPQIPVPGSAADVLIQLAGPSGSAGIGVIQLGTGAVQQTVQDVLRQNSLSVKAFGAKGDYNGTTGTDDTVAINACFEAARLQFKHVYFPAGAYLVTHLLYGTQSTTGQSDSPAGIIGEGMSTSIYQVVGATTTVLQAWGVGGQNWRNFSVNANGNATQCIDTKFFPVGPSVRNDFRQIRCQNSAIVPANGAIWDATNNNDCYFANCVIVGVDAAGANQIGLNFTANGGSNTLYDCYCVNSYLKLGLQNGSVFGGWFFGVMFASGGVNEVGFYGTQHFASPLFHTHFVSESFASFQSARSLGFYHCRFIGQPDSIFDLNISASLEMVGCDIVGTTGALSLLGIHARSDNSSNVKVYVRGGGGPGALTLTDVGGCTVIAQDFMNLNTSLPFNKNWDGTVQLAVAGATTAGTATYTARTLSYTRDGNVVHWTARVTWTGATGTGALNITGFPFTLQQLGATSISYGGATFAVPVFVEMAGSLVRFWNQTTGAAIAISAAGDIELCGHYIAVA